MRTQPTTTINGSAPDKPVGVLCPGCRARVTTIPAGARAVTGANSIQPGERFAVRSVTCPACSAAVRVAVYEPAP